MYDEWISFTSVLRRLRFIGKTVGEFFNIILLRERNDTLVLDDPKPGVMEIGTLILQPVSVLQRKMRFRLQASPWYETRSEQFKRASCIQKTFFLSAEAISAGVRSRNIIPEPFFLKKFRWYRADIFNRMAANPLRKRSASPKNIGVDLSNHRAHHVTDEEVKNSDVIVSIRRSKFPYALQRYPRYKNRIWFLSEICPIFP